MCFYFSVLRKCGACQLYTIRRKKRRKVCQGLTQKHNEEQIRRRYASRANGNVCRLRKVDTTVTGFVLVFALGFAAFAVPGLCVFECSLDLLTQFTRSRIHNLQLPSKIGSEGNQPSLATVTYHIHCTYVLSRKELAMTTINKCVICPGASTLCSVPAPTQVSHRLWLCVWNQT